MGHLLPSELSLPADDRLMRPLFPACALCLALAACAVPQVPPKPPLRTTAATPTTELDANDALDAVARIAAWNTEQQRAERARLDDGRSLTPAARFRLALLLGREDDPAALERALKVLAAIEPEGPRAQAVLDLARNALRAQLDALRQAARAQELQMRIEQIKALEKSLQQRDDVPLSR
ncbi:MAG: hypothetical protein AB1593_03040 [Pseudomonadota bacterium]